MSARHRPPLKSLPGTPTGPRAAAQGALGPAVGEPTGAARKGVPSALRPDLHRDACPLLTNQEGRQAA